MLRRLLTLLAVISGFALAAEPAVAANAGVVSVAAARAAEDCAVVAAPAAEAFRTLRSRADRQGECARPVIRIWVPTVMLQADRARE